MRRWCSEGNEMEVPDIHTLVPHAGSMVLLDRVVMVDDDNLSAEVAIASGSLFCGERGVGGWVGIEYMAQAVAAHAGFTARQRGEPVKVGFLLGTRCYDCSRAFFSVGSVLRIYVCRLLMAENGLGSFECRIEDQDGVAATATINVFQPANVDEFLQGTAT